MTGASSHINHSDLGLSSASRLRSAFYKLRGDSSGPNFGPLTAAEMAEVNGLTEAQLFPRKRKTSTYRGVSFQCVPMHRRHVCCSPLTSPCGYSKQTGRFTAFINANRVMRYLGTFDDEIAAARAYDECVCCFNCVDWVVRASDHVYVQGGPPSVWRQSEEAQLPGRRRWAPGGRVR